MAILGASLYGYKVSQGYSTSYSWENGGNVQWGKHPGDSYGRGVVFQFTTSHLYDSNNYIKAILDSDIYRPNVSSETKWDIIITTNDTHDIWEAYSRGEGTGVSDSGRVAIISKSIGSTENEGWYSQQENIAQFLAPNTTYFIIFAGSDYPFGSYEYGWVDGAPTLSIEYEVASKGEEPSSVLIDKTIAIPSGDVVLSWSGAVAGNNNAITAYGIFYKNEGDIDWTFLKEVASTNTYGSTTVGALSTRGDSRKWGVQTRGSAGASYYSDGYGESPLCKTNSLPGAPSITMGDNRIPSNGGDIQVTGTPGADSDAQTILMAYSLSLAGNKVSFVSGANINIPAGTANVYFWSYDGLEYSSSYITEAIITNTIPTLSDFAVSQDAIGGVPSDVNFPLGIQIDGSVTGNSFVGANLTYEWTCEFSDDTLFGTVVTESLGITSASFLDFLISTLTNYEAGKFFRIKTRVYDEYDYSAWETQTYGYQIPEAPGQPTIQGLFNGIGEINIADTNENQFKNNISTKWTNPTVSNGQANIEKIEILVATSSTIGNYGSYTKVLEILDANTAGSDYVRTWDGANSITNGLYVNIKVKVFDEAGQSSFATFSPVLGYKKSVPINYLGTMPSIANMQPTANPSYINEMLFPIYAGFLDIDPSEYNLTDLQTNYNVKMILDNSSQGLVEIDLTASGTLELVDVLGSDYIKFSISNATLVSLADAEGLANTFNEGEIEVKIIDNFNVSSQIKDTNTFNVEYRVAPVLPDLLGDNYKLRILYGGIGLEGEYLSTASNPNNDIMVNSGERVYFVFPRATDLNDLSDVETYRLYAEYSVDGINYSAKTQISSISAEQGNAEQNLTYEVGAVSQANFVKFTVEAVDSTGLTSNQITFAAHLVFSRVSSPLASIVSAEKDAQNEQINISWSLDQIGGNNGDTISYSSYPNLERTILPSPLTSYYNKQCQLEIVYSYNGEFAGEENTHIETYDSTNSYSSLGGNVIINETDPLFLAADKIWIKATVKLRSGFSQSAVPASLDYIESEYAIPDFILYSLVQTVAYRKNTVAINTGQAIITQKSDGALIVSSTTGKGKIYFVGYNLSAEEQVIEIDLDERKIKGAIIEGGEW